MNLFQQYGRRLICLTVPVIMMSISGCSGITPDGNMRNTREEGPESGLFSGPGGEFVLVAPASESDDKKDEETEGGKDVKSDQ